MQYLDVGLKEHGLLGIKALGFSASIESKDRLGIINAKELSKLIEVTHVPGTNVVTLLGKGIPFSAVTFADEFKVPDEVFDINAEISMASGMINYQFKTVIENHVPLIFIKSPLFVIQDIRTLKEGDFDFTRFNCGE